MPTAVFPARKCAGGLRNCASGHPRDALRCSAARAHRAVAPLLVDDPTRGAGDTPG